MVKGCHHSAVRRSTSVRPVTLCYVAETFAVTAWRRGGSDAAATPATPAAPGGSAAG